MSCVAALLPAPAPNAAAPAIGRLAARGPVIQRSCAECGTGKSDEGKCPACDDAAAIGVQAKLTIGAPDDPLEKEADEVADKVMRMPAQGSAPAIDAPRSGEAPLRRRAAAAFASPGPGFAAALASQSAGAPLAPAARGFLEPRFARDLGHVRVHDGAEAGALAREIGARAFTFGSHVYFASGQYDPASREGRRLLAHELTHVLQQHQAASAVRRQPARPPYDYDNLSAPEQLAPPASIDLEEIKAAVDKLEKEGVISGKKVTGYASKTEEAMLYLLLYQVVRREKRNIEMHLIAPIGVASPGGAAPLGNVIVRVDAAGKAEAILFTRGAPAPPPLVGVDDAKTQLRTIYKFADVTDEGGANPPPARNAVQPRAATWTPQHISMVLGALAVMKDRAPLDVVALEGVVLRRVSQIPGAAPGRDVCGKFTNEGYPSYTLLLADCAFRTTNFVRLGQREAPGAYFTIAHEIGHAVETAGWREARNREAESFAETEALRSTANTRGPGRKAATKQFFAQEKVLAARRTALGGETALPMLLARAGTAHAAAVLEHSIRMPLTEALPAPAQPYRSALDAANGALGELAKALYAAEDPGQQDHDKLQQAIPGLAAAAKVKVEAAKTEREKLRRSQPNHDGLRGLASVTKTQDAWYAALDLAIEQGDRTRRLQKFVNFVTENKITPFSVYAAEHAAQPDEFFADSYALFLTDPDFLRDHSKLLFDWFKRGKYR